MTEISKLKRAVIKEEYVAITGDFQKAVILNQFIYWSERVKDFDNFIIQENKRATEHGLEEQDLTHGWIYKTAEELSEETMLGLSSASMRSHIKSLIDKGFISERNNPKYKWDRTKQYRVNLVEITKVLLDYGYTIEGYKINLSFLEIKNGELKNKNESTENSNAIPEIISNTTPKTKTKIKKESNKNSFDEIITTYSMKFELPVCDEITDLLGEWLKVRKAKRAAMTDRAIQMNIEKLDKLALKSGLTVVEYLKEVICRGWAAFYEIKTFGNNTPQPEQQEQKRYGGVYIE